MNDTSIITQQQHALDAILKGESDLPRQLSALGVFSGRRQRIDDKLVNTSAFDVAHAQDPGGTANDHYFSELAGVLKREEEKALVERVLTIREQSAQTINQLLLEGGTFDSHEIAKAPTHVRDIWHYLPSLEGDQSSLLRDMQSESYRERRLADSLHLLAALVGKPVAMTFRPGNFDSDLIAGGERYANTTDPSRIVAEPFHALVVDPNSKDHQRFDHVALHEDLRRLSVDNGQEQGRRLFDSSRIKLTSLRANPVPGNHAFIGIEYTEDSTLDSQMNLIYLWAQRYGLIAGAASMPEIAFKFLQFQPEYNQTPVHRSTGPFLSQYLGERDFGIMPTDIGGNSAISTHLLSSFGFGRRAFFSYAFEALAERSALMDTRVELKSAGDDLLDVIDINPFETHPSKTLTGVSAFQGEKKEFARINARFATLAYERYIETISYRMGDTGNYCALLGAMNSLNREPTLDKIKAGLGTSPAALNMQEITEESLDLHEELARIPQFDLTNTAVRKEPLQYDLVDRIRRGDLTQIDAGQTDQLKSELTQLHDNQRRLKHLFEAGSGANHMLALQSVEYLEGALVAEEIDRDKVESAFAALKILYHGSFDGNWGAGDFHRLCRAQKYELLPTLWQGDVPAIDTEVDGFLKQNDRSVFTPQLKYKNIDDINAKDSSSISRAELESLLREARSLYQDLEHTDGIKATIAWDMPAITHKGAINEGSADFTVNTSTSGDPVNIAYRVADSKKTKGYQGASQPLLVLEETAKKTLHRDGQPLTYFSHALPFAVIPFTRPYLEDHFEIRNENQPRVEENAKNIAGKPICEIIAIHHRAHKYQFSGQSEVLDGWFEKRNTNYDSNTKPHLGQKSGALPTFAQEASAPNFYESLEDRFDTLSTEFRDQVVKKQLFGSLFESLKARITKHLSGRGESMEDNIAVDFFDAHQFDIARGHWSQYNTVGSVLFTQSVGAYLAAFADQTQEDSPYSTDLLENLDVVAHAMRILHWTRHFNEHEQQYRMRAGQERTEQRVFNSEQRRQELLQWYAEKGISESYEKKDDLLALLGLSASESTAQPEWMHHATQLIQLAEDVFENKLEQPWKGSKPNNYHDFLFGHGDLKDGNYQRGLIARLGRKDSYSSSVLFSMIAANTPYKENADYDLCSMDENGKYHLNHSRINEQVQFNLSQEREGRAWINSAQMFEQYKRNVFSADVGVMQRGNEVVITDQKLFNEKRGELKEYEKIIVRAE